MREEVEPYQSEHSKRKQRLENIRSGKIDRDYLMPLIMGYKSKKELNEDYPVPRELSEVFQIIIEKNIGAPRWRSYTDDWKDDMRTRAMYHLLKYCHNFDPFKCESGKNDPYNYFAMVATTAFIQSWKKCKAYSDNQVLMNPDVIYNENKWDSDQEHVPDVMQNTPNIDSMDWGEWGNY